jgi:DNA-binding MarR family transcriptional regulator
VPHQNIKFMQGKDVVNISSGEKNAPDRVNEFLGAAHVFATAMHTVLDEELLRDAAYGQLTASQLKLLKLVGLNDSLTVGDAAAFLKVSKAAASKAVDKLVRRMYLQRSPGKLDRRETCLSLTDASRNLLSRYESQREEKLKEIFSMSIPAELHRVSALLDCLTARIAIENFSAQPGKLCMQCGTYFRESCLLRTQLGRECFHLRSKK